MAALANFYNSLFESSSGRQDRAGQGGAKAGDARTRGTGESARVRAFANEDVYFYVKKIDNSRVVRQHDPVARSSQWKLIGTGMSGAALAIALFLPSAYSLMAGYQIQSLRSEKAKLDAERASLELQEANLLSSGRMEALAKEQRFIDPPADKVVYLENHGSLALNQK